MGCEEAKESNFPVLMCFFQIGNEEQKEFCLKLRDSIHHEKTIKYEIKSTAEPFSIKLKIKNIIHDISTTYTNNSEEEIQKNLNEIYRKLDEK